MVDVENNVLLRVIDSTGYINARTSGKGKKKTTPATESEKGKEPVKKRCKPQMVCYLYLSMRRY